jgi:hypothetical protein
VIEDGAFCQGECRMGEAATAARDEGKAPGGVSLAGAAGVAGGSKPGAA